MIVMTLICLFYVLAAVSLIESHRTHMYQVTNQNQLLIVVTYWCAAARSKASKRQDNDSLRIGH